MTPPGTTGSGLSVFEIVNAPGAGPEVTVVVIAADVLLRSLLSGIVWFGSTTAVFVIDPVTAGDVALIVMVPLDPAFTRPPSQSTVTGEPEEVQTNRLFPLAETSPTPAGRVSTTRMPVALTEPLLLTVRVYSSGLLMTALDGPALLIVRSGRGEGLGLNTWVVADAVEVKFCADLVPVTLAVLFIVVPFGAVTFPVMVTVQDSPPFRVPAEQDTR
jgi:hypothetical protein